MPWVNTELNGPWYPIEQAPSKASARDFPEQYREVSQELWEALRNAWRTLNEFSARVDEDFPIQITPRKRRVK